MEALSLYELNSLVKELLQVSFADSYWVTAELSEVRVSAKGHCFLELIQKDPRSSVPVAKARAVIMSYIFPMLKMTFEETTGQSFCAGIKVQLKAEISFSELYGYSLVVQDIDPTYTMGSLAQLRKEILNKLADEGILDINRSLTLPTPLQRIAVISSAGAAGYGDFCNQLDNNAQGFCFVHRLFPATMQGVDTAPSIIGALDRIASDADRWDCVVIIRGGGAVSDLAGYEDYDLASCCAQFPLPIITGIGHERDTTVLDFVAHTHLKTPTAVAAFLIDNMDREAKLLLDIESAIFSYTENRLKDAKMELGNLAHTLNTNALNVCHNQRSRLLLLYQRLCQKATNIIQAQQQRLPDQKRLYSLALRQLGDRQQHLASLERAVSLYDPTKILKLGYSITRLDGHVVRNPADLQEGQTIVTTLRGGEIHSTITKTKSKQPHT